MACASRSSVFRAAKGSSMYITQITSKVQSCYFDLQKSVNAEGNVLYIISPLTLTFMSFILE